MALIIKQGKQDTSKDGIFEPLEEKDVVLAITGIKLCDPKVMEDTLEIEFKVIASEKYVGRKVWDRVTFSPTSDFSWKYRALRKAAGCPYSEDEGDAVDIEGLLLNHAVGADLSIRKGKDKSGNEKSYQAISYKVLAIEDNGDTLEDINPFTPEKDEFEAGKTNETPEPNGAYMPSNLADESDFS